jgi:hypothetical protein
VGAGGGAALTHRSSGVVLGTLLALSAIPDRSARAGDWWDPSGAVALPQVQNSICKNSGVLCKRQNQIRLVTLDYIQNGLYGDGWTEFTSIGSGLPAGFSPEDCLDSEQIQNRLRHGNFDGNVLQKAGSPLSDNVGGTWNFRPMPGWASPGQTSPSFAVEALPQREFIFDFVSSMRHNAPRDIKMTILIQVLQDGAPQPDYERTYRLKFQEAADQFRYMCLLPRFGIGNYELNFLVSDDFFGEDEPISIHLSVNYH